jgi:mRNA-degrading endonuclease HigB of HigAB toxin-antitoxin module
MRIIKRAALVRFWSQHPDAKGNLGAWYGVVRKAKWTTPIEMKQVYAHADLVTRLMMPIARVLILRTSRQ